MINADKVMKKSLYIITFPFVFEKCYVMGLYLSETVKLVLI